MKDIDRKVWGEPKQNRASNSTPNSKYPAGDTATRKKGRNRFKTGKKSQKKG